MFPEVIHVTSSLKGWDLMTTIFLQQPKGRCNGWQNIRYRVFAYTRFTDPDNGMLQDGGRIGATMWFKAQGVRLLNVKGHSLIVLAWVSWYTSHEITYATRLRESCGTHTSLSSRRDACIWRLYEAVPLLAARTSRCTSPHKDPNLTISKPVPCPSLPALSLSLSFENRINPPQQNEPQYIYGYIPNFVWSWAQNLSQDIFKVRLSRCSMPTPEKSGQ